MAARLILWHAGIEIVLRVGINLGDMIVEGDDILGDGVNVATRMQKIAPPGEISVSGVVYESVSVRPGTL